MADVLTSYLTVSDLQVLKKNGLGPPGFFSRHYADQVIAAIDKAVPPDRQTAAQYEADMNDVRGRYAEYETYKGKVEQIRSEGPHALAGRVEGALVAYAFNKDVLWGSEAGAAFGGAVDAGLLGSAGRAARDRLSAYENAIPAPQAASNETVPTEALKPEPPLGESMIKPSERSGANIDVAVQKHSEARDFREQSGTAVQSAHQIPSSAAKDLVNYSRSQALTVLMPREVHAAFDNAWKAWARGQVAQGRTTVTVREFLRVLDRAAAGVPELKGRTADTMSWLFQIEAYQTLGLSPDDQLRVPYSQ